MSLSLYRLPAARYFIYFFNVLFFLCGWKLLLFFVGLFCSAVVYYTRIPLYLMRLVLGITIYITSLLCHSTHTKKNASLVADETLEAEVYMVAEESLDVGLTED